MRILINTSQVADIGRRLVSDGQRLIQVGRRLSAAVGGLDWESRARVGMGDDLAAACSQAEALGQRLVGLGERLVRIADTFEQADTESVRSLSAVPWDYLVPAAGGGSASWWGALRGALGEVAFLGGFIEAVGALQVVTWRSFGECLWNWLHGRGWRSNRQIRDEAAAQEEEARRQRKREEARRRREEAERSREEARVVQQDHVHAVPLRSQSDLYGSAACAPTCVSMVLDYYHAQDEKHRTASPKELIGMLDSGDGVPGRGVGLSRMRDELEELGYTGVTEQVNADWQTLAAQLEDAPVIVTVGVGLVGPGTRKSDVPRAITGPGGTVHAMVVKGLSSDGGSVIVNDPWTGRELRLSREQFDEMWARGSRGMFVIRP